MQHDFRQGVPGTLRLDEKSVRIEGLMEGGMVERGNKALAQVIANIFDPNTEPNAVREVNIKLKFKPIVDGRRDTVNCTIHVTPKLAPPAPIGTNVLLGKKGTTVGAYENNPNQLRLDDEAEEVADVG